ncbi:hypothetical protein [Piscirickettsia salmonis]|uniref:hypothetical protein n=1 Tax=Piscirickettsia salmonis TaxID=1238 RepID=UPI0007C890C1|nr:hypothetical protein A0O36_01374 [Piscirickettsiaceae bacterium NZ-RLO1]
MPSSRFDPQALAEIAVLYIATYQRDNSYQNPENEYGKLYSAAQQLERQARKGKFSEEEGARVLRALLERINNNLKVSFQQSDLGYKIQETLRQFYDISPNHIEPPGYGAAKAAHQGLHGPFLSSLKAYKLQEDYLGKSLDDLITSFEECKQKTKGYPEFTNSERRSAIKKEILRQVETDGVDKTIARNAQAVLASHSSFTGIGKTDSTKKSLRNPQVFTQLYTAHDKPEILDMNQKQLVDEFNRTKDNKQLSTEDKSYALKELKYALVDHIARSGKLDNVTLQEVNQVIDHRRHHRAFSTNTRKYVSEHPRLKQILSTPKALEPLFQQATEAETKAEGGAEQTLG